VVSASTNKKIPDWVPIYPSVKIENLSFREGLEQKQFGSFIFTTQDEEREVVNFYHSQFTSSGWKRDGYNNIIAKSASNERTITVNVSTYIKEDKQLTKMLVSFEEMKP
jgi:hypothetical protein